MKYSRTIFAAGLVGGCVYVLAYLLWERGRYAIDEVIPLGFLAIFIVGFSVGAHLAGLMAPESFLHSTAGRFWMNDLMRISSPRGFRIACGATLLFFMLFNYLWVVFTFALYPVE
jgi:hypothetical protein